MAVDATRPNEKFMFDLGTTQEREANIHRHAFYHVPVFGVTYVEFFNGVSSYQPEFIAKWMGQIPLKQSLIDEDQLEFAFEFKGPGMFSSDDIPGLPVPFRIPILPFGKGESIKGNVILNKGTAAEHVRWKCFSTAAMREKEGRYFLEVGSVGAFSETELQREMRVAVPKVTQEVPTSIYWRVSKI